eukprot:TRINITY_DN1068_c0_g1_i6.p1 TRINITY_DN1068_c0_g1~~TRINITY_DN1068_c0_g1_i6.p1  ORF type:complete len:362 (-),score=50.73 TRINITY_DN1068_c0_g1_i6:160-1149(-)
MLDWSQNLRSIVGCWSKLAGSPTPFGFSKMHFIHTSSMAQKDYYDILGVPRNANENEIKKAFYQQAKKYHPDSNKGDPDAQVKFQEVQKAYEVLKDTEKRRMYDQLGSAENYENVEKGGGDPGGGPFGANPFAGPGGFGFGGFGGAGASMEDILEELFGQGRTGAGRSPFGGFRQQIGVQVIIDFMEAIKGGTKQFQFGLPNLGIPSQRVDVHIPPGATDGTKLKIEIPQIRQANVDVIVQLTVKPHPYFERSGNDILVRHSVSFVDALLGSQFKVESVLGPKIDVRIPPGTQHGDQIIKTGHGAPILGGAAGQRGAGVVHVIDTVLLP